jgi:hypothetical protein
MMMPNKVITPDEELILDPAAYTWLLVGDNMAGKSTLFSRVPGARFIAIGANIRHLRVPQVWPKTWAQAKEDTKAAVEDPSVSFIVLDSIDAFHQYAYRDTCKNNPWRPGVDHVSEIDMAKGWDLSEDRFNEFIWWLKYCGKGVGMIANELWVEKNFKGEKIHQYLPDLDKRGRRAVSRAADIKARMFVDSERGEGGNLISKRYITCASEAKFTVGDRTGRLEKYGRIELTSPENCWNDIIKAFQGEPS